MKKIIVLFSLLIAVAALRSYFLLINFEGSGLTLAKITRSMIEFSCYAIPYIIFSWRKTKAKEYSILLTLIVGSIFYYLFTLMYGVYVDWQYISIHQQEFFERHIKMVFEAQISFRVFFVIIFLFCNWILGKFFAEVDIDKYAI